MQTGAVDNLPKRLRAKRNGAGLTLEQAAEKVGLSVSQISRLERGESEITLQQVQRFADAYDFRFKDLLQEDGELGEVLVKGRVQAGAWVEALEWPPDDWYGVAVPRHPKYGQFPTQALEVGGPSMNRVYPEGSVVVFVSFIDLDRQPEHGERVIVRRRDRQGMLEATVKTFRRDEQGRPWLWPDSDHPEYQAPIQLDQAGPEIEEIAIVGLVTHSVRFE